MDFPDNAVVENPLAIAGDERDVGSIPGPGKSSGVGNGNPLQNSCLEKFHRQRSLTGYSPVHGVAESDMSECTQRDRQTDTHTRVPVVPVI